MEKTPIIILAAGESKRLGFSKQLVHFQGDTLLNNSIKLACSISKNVTVILGANFNEISKSITNKQTINILRNENWKSGMASSIKLGVEFHRNADKILIMLCDQIYLTNSILLELFEKEKQSQKPIIACNYGEKIGVPILFNQTIFNDLMALSGDKGASAILKNHQESIESILFEKGIFDVDSPQDLIKHQIKKA